MRAPRERGTLRRLGRALRDRAARHAGACALALAWLLVPEPFWQAARLSLLGALEGRADAAATGAGPAGAEDPIAHAPCARCVTLEAIAAESALARDRALAALAQAVALDAAALDAPPAERIPAGVRGGAAAARLALASPAARGFRVRLDAGAERGIRPGQPVLDGAALAGRVTAAIEGTAEVLLLPSPRLQVRAIAVRIPDDAARPDDLPAAASASASAPPRAPVAGIAEGDGEHGLTFRPADPGADLLPGDRVLVDAGSTFAPRGVLLGAVVEVRVEPATGAVEARVAPAARLAALDRVLVLARAGLLDGAADPAPPPLPLEGAGRPAAPRAPAAPPAPPPAPLPRSRP